MVELTQNQMSHFNEVRDEWRESQVDDNLLKYINGIRKKVEEKNWDFIFILIGDRRSGKSTLAQIILMLLEYGWNPWNRICFTVLETLRRIRDGKPRTGLFWDEIGAGWDAWRFMSTESDEAKKIFQMVGELNYYFGFTAPGFKDVASAGRKICNVIFWTSANPRGFVRVYDVFTNALTSEIRYKLKKKMTFNELPDVMYDTYNLFKVEFLREQIDKSIERVEFIKIKEELTRKQFDLWFAVRRLEGLGFTDLATMFPKSTVDHQTKLLHRMGYLKKENEQWIALMPKDMR